MVGCCMFLSPIPTLGLCVVGYWDYVFVVTFIPLKKQLFCFIGPSHYNDIPFDIYDTPVNELFLNA